MTENQNVEVGDKVNFMRAALIENGQRQRHSFRALLICLNCRYISLIDCSFSCKYKTLLLRLLGLNLSVSLYICILCYMWLGLKNICCWKGSVQLLRTNVSWWQAGMLSIVTLWVSESDVVSNDDDFGNLSQKEKKLLSTADKRKLEAYRPKRKRSCVVHPTPENIKRKKKKNKYSVL